MTGPDERPSRSGRGTGRLLVYASVVLAAAAAAVLAVSSEDARLLRLGIVAALWAALAGMFAAARLRRELASAAGKAEDLRKIYRLELEREVAARREHELAVERDLRRDMDQRSRAELDALRAELRTLRENLESAVGGELLVERVALHAESTRVRSLAEPELSSPPLGAGGLPQPSHHQDPLFGDMSGSEPDQTSSWRPAVNGTGRPANGTSTSSWSQPGNGAHVGNGQRAGDAAGHEADRDTFEAPDGAHTGGTSVADLLSAHGAGVAPRRRRSRDNG